MNNCLNKTTITTLTLAALAGPFASAEDEHDHHKQYINEGEVDIALVFHADEGGVEFALFADQDHGHDDHDDHDEHDEHDEHGDDYDNADEHHHGEAIDLDEAVILAGANARFTLPESGDFDFLGEAGSTFYRLPQDPTAGPAAPGFAMEFEDGIFVDDVATVRLTGLEGPGDLVAYILDGFGDVTIVFDTRDGFDAQDVYTGVGESHQHLNWVFTQPGIYHLGLEGSAQLVSDQRLLSTSSELMVQVGSGLAYIREIESYQRGWARTESLGDVYTANFPWLYVPLLNGWAFASGDGGDDMFLFVQALNSWTYTSAEAARWFYNFGSASWIYVLSRPDGSVYKFDTATESWSLLP